MMYFLGLVKHNIQVQFYSHFELLLNESMSRPLARNEDREFHANV
jgi:hypothetical protein